MFWNKKKKEKKESEEKTEQNEAIEGGKVSEPNMKAADIIAESMTIQDEDDAADELVNTALEKKDNWLSRLSGGLSKSSNKIGQGIVDIFTKKKLDDETLEELEDLLITADLGPKTAMTLVEGLRKERFGKEIDSTEIKTYLAEKITAILEPVTEPLIFDHDGDGPFVLLVAGVNGAGKTTTIGKIAHSLKSQGKSVMLAAGDTFRAAAVEQLQVWGERTGVPVLAKDIGADAAAVAYEAYEAAQGVDVLMIDTAGRLHNKANLMEELAKIVRVLKKKNETLPHACLLVLDATTGQNAHAQLEVFKEMVDVTGLVVTKLDGSAKGGVIVSLADQFGLPIHMIGVGETAQDLQPFRAQDFANSLLGIEA